MHLGGCIGKIPPTRPCCSTIDWQQQWAMKRETRGKKAKAGAKLFQPTHSLAKAVRFDSSSAVCYFVIVFCIRTFCMSGVLFSFVSLLSVSGDIFWAQAVSGLGESPIFGSEEPYNCKQERRGLQLQASNFFPVLVPYRFSNRCYVQHQCN